MDETVEPVRDAQEAAKRIVFRPHLRDPDVLGVTRFFAAFPLLAAAGTVVSLALGRSRDSAVCAVCVVGLCALMLVLRTAIVHGYVAVDRDKVYVGFFRRWPSKTVDRSEISKIRWVPRSAKVHGMILDARGDVLAHMPQFIPKQRVMQIAELLDVPFDGTPRKRR